MEPATMGLIGSVLGSGLQALGGRAAMDSNSAQNSINIAHQNLWRTTAHQVEVEDLKKAGLNPMLSAMGSGAASPTGSSIGVSNPLEGMASAAKEAAMFKAQIGKLEAETNNIKTDTKTKGGSAELNDLIKPLIKKVGDWMGNSSKDTGSGFVDKMLDNVLGNQEENYKKDKIDVINEFKEKHHENFKKRSIIRGGLR